MPIPIDTETCPHLYSMQKMQMVMRKHERKWNVFFPPQFY